MESPTQRLRSYDVPRGPQRDRRRRIDQACVDVEVNTAIKHSEGVVPFRVGRRYSAGAE